MDGPSLSGHERHILQQVEAALRQDARFDRRMQSLDQGCNHRLRRVRLSPGRSLALLCMLSMSLMIAAILTANTPLTVAFAAVWGLTLAVAVIWLCAWSRKVHI